MEPLLDLNLVDPDHIPLPPEAVRFEGISIEPLADGRRLRLKIDLTPFQQRPNLLIEAKGPSGRDAGEVSVLEAMDARMELTFHLRGPEESGPYELHFQVFYHDEDEGDQVVDQRTATIELEDGTV